MSIEPGLATLSWESRLLRCFFLMTEALVDRALLEHVLVDSLRKFVAQGVGYPFVRPAELKPGGLAPSTEHPLHNTALVLFLEHGLPGELKPYVRARRLNELVAKNLQRFGFSLPGTEEGVAQLREIVSTENLNALRDLFNHDLALLVERREVKPGAYTFEFSHFHVMVDAVLDAMIEDYGLELRYLSKSLYEQGEDYAGLLEQKFFEGFGMKNTASGRRTAAVVAHRLLTRHGEGLNIVYCGSVEARCLYKFHRDGTVSRFVLVPLTDEEETEVLARHKLAPAAFEAGYLLPATDGVRAAILYVRSVRTPPALPPADRKLRRDISAAERWISTEEQLLLPLPWVTDRPPLEWNWLYRSAGRAQEE